MLAYGVPPTRRDGRGKDGGVVVCDHETRAYQHPQTKENKDARDVDWPACD